MFQHGADGDGDGDSERDGLIVTSTTCSLPFRAMLLLFPLQAEGAPHEGGGKHVHSGVGVTAVIAVTAGCSSCSSNRFSIFMITCCCRDGCGDTPHCR